MTDRMAAATASGHSKGREGLTARRRGRAREPQAPLLGLRFGPCAATRGGSRGRSQRIPAPSGRGWGPANQTDPGLGADVCTLGGAAKALTIASVQRLFMR
jgi:hypothetical protein